MLRFRRAPLPEEFAGTVNHDPYFGSTPRPTPQNVVQTPRDGWLGKLGSSPQPRTLVRRRLSAEGGRALEILGHAIEYLADEYAADLADKGPLGSADPRVAAIQILKERNRAIYYSGTEVQAPFRRLKRWLGR
jgi:hypothetical protein